MLVESQGLPSNSTCVHEAEPGKLDIKRREASILFISLPIQWFSLRIRNYEEQVNPAMSKLLTLNTRLMSK